MINSLIMLYQLFFSNFGLGIIFFTIAVRGLMFPLTLRQSRQIKQMGALAPKMREIQDKHAGDKPRASRETMRLYKEAGVNPIGCLGPMVVQFPIFIGLYQALRQTLPSTPERLAGLSEHLYTWLPQVNSAVPLDSNFLGLDLATTAQQAGAVGWVLAVVVGASMWLMQKMTSMPAADARQESTQRTMLWMMPLMFGYFTLFFQSGLALYWIISNIVGIVIQGSVSGWAPLLSLSTFWKSRPAAEAAALDAPAEEGSTDAGPQGDSDGREDTGRSDRDRTKGTRRRSRGGRNRRRKSR
jgi:YidC/Oxa1 family membrane protein insertase